MRRKLFYAIFMTLIFTLLFSTNFGYCNDFTSKRVKNDPYESWTIEFNQPYDYEYILELSDDHSIYPISIYNKEDTLQNIPVDYVRKSSTELEVIPKSGYIKNIQYILDIKNNYVKSLNGLRLNERIQLPFELTDDSVLVKFDDGVLEDIVRKIIGKKVGPIYKHDLG